MHLGYGENEYGTQVSVHQCEMCHQRFTLCPAKAPETKGWENCLSEGCPSYDVTRDVDTFWDIEMELGAIRREVLE